MRGILQEVARMLAAFLVASIVLTGLALIAAATGSEEPGRLARKVLVPLFIAIYLVIGRLPKNEFLAAVGTPAPGWARGFGRYALGWIAGVVSLVALGVLLVALGGFDFIPKRSALDLLDRGLRYLGAGLVLAILEEVLFRGVIHFRLWRAGGTTTAVLLGAFLFAIAHFLNPPKGRPMDGFDAAWDVVPGLLAGVGTIPSHVPEVLGLFGVGLILSLLRVRTGGILIPMGVHAGWFWVRNLDSKMLHENKAILAEHPLLFGSLRYYDGILGWGALFLTFVLVAMFTRPRRAKTPYVAS